MAPLIFADAHNMVAFLTKSDASEGFDQIVDFLNAHTIQYALVVNPTIYVSCIKKFWASVSIKKSNDAVKLHALIDRKKVIITEDTIRQNLRLDDADGIDCLPNEEIFAELVQMGYEKLSTKLTFYKLMETCDTLTKKVANLERDKVAQALEFVKLKQRVRKLEKKKRTKHSGLKRGGGIAELDTNEDVTLVDMDAEVEMDASIQERIAESQAKESAPRRKRGIVIQDPEETAAASVIVHTEVKPKDKGKGILIEETKHLKRQA
nr:hypothetical protein [Tanacetum cinerariifolium]